MLAQLQSLEGMSRVGGFASELTCVAVGGETSVPCHLGLSLGLLECLHDMAAGSHRE